jgi:hypothetical protein
MRFKHITKLGTAILLTVLVFSCGKETQATTQGGGKLKLVLTSTPTISNGEIIMPNIFNPGTLQGRYIDLKKNGKVETDEFSVTSGQNFSVMLYGGSATGCTTLKLEAYVNGKLIQTITHTAGGTYGTTTCEYPASNYGNGIFGIPCNIIIQ